MNTPKFSSPETPPTTVELQTDDIEIIAQRAKELCATIVEAQTELSAMPREALITATWQGLVDIFYDMYILDGEDPDNNSNFRTQINYRLSLLTPQERQLAVNEANAWLDDSCVE